MAIRMEIAGAKELETGTQILVLREVGGLRFAAIQMRVPELAAIVAAETGLAGPRPSTHIAWANTVRTAGISLEELIIHGIGGDDAVLCLLKFRLGDHAWTIDCRPSDGIVLALRLNAPIMVEEHILRLMALETDKLKEGERKVTDERWRRYLESLGDNIPKA